MPSLLFVAICVTNKNHEEAIVHATFPSIITIIMKKTHTRHNAIFLC